MPITPTSTKSKNYQALGIDEIANDIETAFTSINSLETTVDNLPAAGTTTTINISSAQILAMGDTPIELLPAPGSGKYYDIEKVIIEGTGVTTAYTSANLYFQQPYAVLSSSILSNLSAGNKTFAVMSNLESAPFTSTSWGGDLNGSFGQSLSDYDAFPFELTTDGGTNPTIGDGTLRAIITYTTRTFGA